MIDQLDRKILVTISENARVTYADIGRMVNLTPPAVAERIRKMEERGIIQGYRTQIDPKAIGYSIVAFVVMLVEPQGESRLMGFAEQKRRVLECHNVTGPDTFILKVAAESIETLEEEVLQELMQFGQTKTYIVLSSHKDDCYTLIGMD